jgi:hypothetical protein
MISDESRQAIRILLSTPWFCALVAGTEIVIFAVGLAIGLSVGR